MAVRNGLLLLFLIGLIFGAGACEKKVTDSTDKQKPAPEAQNSGLIGVIKNGKLANFQTTTIGNAFDSYKYLNNKAWMLKQEGRTFIVSFLGWFDPGVLTEEEKKSGVTGRGIDVKFVIESNGAYYVFMILKAESRSDGKIYTTPMNDMASILDSIYANKKISL